jgi:hypothetical protein
MDPFVHCVIGWSLFASFAAQPPEQKYLEYLTKVGNRHQLKHRLEL